MTLTFEGTLTHSDSKKHISHVFDVPQDITKLNITFEHQPHQATGSNYANQVSLSLFDPNGSRGARHNNPQQTINLSIAEATPGYLAGDIPAGQWTVVVDTHRILSPDPLTYTITVTMSDEIITEAPLQYTKGSTTLRGIGWYRGDLHGHTLHSDGKWDVPDFIQYARDFNLDFVTLTDHNTVSGLAQLDSLRADDVLTMGGMELTTYHGHALALGTREWQEWRTHEKTMTEIAQAIMDKGILFVIAHPKSPGDPACTGCRWEFDEMMPGIAPAVEIWNGIWRPYNQEGLELYYQWLNEGHRLVATTGTDIHGKPPANVRSAASNVVYAEELSEQAILDAIRQGHLYLSGGVDLRLTAKTDKGAEVMMGDTLATHDSIQVNASWQQVEVGERVRLIVNGTVSDEFDAMLQSEKSWMLDPETMDWLLIEVRDKDNQMRAITNPIFIATNMNK